MLFISISLFFFFNDTATTEIYTLSLHDALPISGENSVQECFGVERINADIATVSQGFDRAVAPGASETFRIRTIDRKSTRLNSSHPSISYAVFCLKKKKKHTHLHLSPNIIQQPL